MAECQVNFEYDNEAKVWIATSDDVTGLVLESESLDKLIEKVLNAAPELIELNHLPNYQVINFSISVLNKSKKLKFPIYKQKRNTAVKDDCRRILIQGLNHIRNKFFLSLQGVSFFFTKMKEMPFKNKITNSEKK